MEKKSKVKGFQAGVDRKAVPKVTPKRPVSATKTPSRPSSSASKAAPRPPSAQSKAPSRPASSRPASKASSRPSSARPKQKTPTPTPDQQALVRAAVAGDLKDEYPPGQKIVRIFTSSTFTDTKVERNTLMRDVYPGLKAYCQKLGYEFQIVDMRWGVRDEATDDHMTSELCMREIQACQRLSTGPNFITFLSQKYGYRPFPPKISVEEFETILKNVPKSDDQKLLKSWFLKDGNVVPPIYQLQPIRNKLEHYVNDEQPEKKKKARDDWWAAFESMQIILRDAAIKCLKDNDSHKYRWSVTEEEIYNGIEIADKTKDTCHWFKRTITDLEKNAKSKQAKRFMDIGKDIDKEAQGLLKDLKNNKVQKKLPVENITEYQVKWTDNGIDPDNSAEHKKYIDNFKNDFDRVLKQMIDKGINDRENRDIDDKLYQECVQHATFAQTKSKQFRGRQAYLTEVEEKVKGMNGSTLVLCGEAGCGKTTLMAKVATCLSEWLEDEAGTLILRFVGTTGESGSTSDLLTSLCVQMARISADDLCGEASKGKIEETHRGIPQELKPLMSHFKERLEEFDKPMCMILDSLDQLRDKGGNLQDWIPETTPSNVRLIISAIPDEKYTVVPKLKTILSNERFITIPPLSPDDVSLILDDWFQGVNRSAQPAQMDVLTKACNACSIPLYTKIAFDEACRWNSYITVGDIKLETDVAGLIHALFDRVEKYHGSLLVNHALAYVTAAKEGLGLGEMEDVLSLDEDVLNDVYQYHLPPLRRLPPLIWVRIQNDLLDYLVSSGADGIQVNKWYHRQFRTVAEERYLTEPEKKKKIHQVLYEYFLGAWAGNNKKPYTDKKGMAGEAERHVAEQPLVFKEEDKDSKDKRGSDAVLFNLRKLNELPYHLIYSGRLDMLKEHALCNFMFIYEKIRALGVFSVLKDFALAKEAGAMDDELQVMCDCLDLSVDGITHDITLLPCHLLGRLLQVDLQQYPYLQKFVTGARNPHFDCLVPSRGFLKSSGGPYLKKFVGHEGGVNVFGVNPSQTKMASFGDCETLRIWDLESGEEERSVPKPSGAFIITSMMTPLQWCLNDTMVATVGMGNFVMMKLSGEDTFSYVEKIPHDDNNTKGSLYLYEKANLAFSILDRDVLVCDIKTKKKVMTIPRKNKPVDEPPNTARGYVGGVDGHIVIYNNVSNQLHFFKWEDYQKSKKFSKTVDIFPADKLDYYSCMTTSTSAGIVACYLYNQEAVSAMKEAMATIKTYDIKTGKLLNDWTDKFNAGMVMGNECFMATGPDIIVFSPYMVGDTVFKEYNLTTGKACDTLVLASTAMLQASAPAGGSKLVITTISDMNVLQLVDISRCREDTDRDMVSNYSKPKSDGYYIRRPIHNSRRYIAFETIQGGMGVWDMTTNKTIRHAKSAAVTGSATRLLSPDKCVTVDYPNNIYYLDLKKCTVLKTVKKSMVASTTISQFIPVQVLHKEEKMLFIGPKPNEISIYDLKKGAVETKMAGPSKKKYGGLLVSRNEKMAVALENHEDSMKDRKNFTIDTFDLQKKKPGVVLKIESTADVLTYTVALKQQGMMVKDNTLLLTLCLKKRTHPWLYDLTTGKGQQFVDKRCEDDDVTEAMMTTTDLILAVYNSPTCIVWDSNTLKRKHTVILDDYRSTVHASPEGDLFALKSGDRNKIDIISSKTGERLFKFYLGVELHDLVFTTDSQFALVSVGGVEGIVPVYFHKAVKDKQEQDKQNAKEKNDGKATKNDKAAKNDKATKKGKAPDKTKSKDVVKGEDSGDGDDTWPEKQARDGYMAEKDIFGEFAMFEPQGEPAS